MGIVLAARAPAGRRLSRTQYWPRHPGLTTPSSPTSQEYPNTVKNEQKPATGSLVCRLTPGQRMGPAPLSRHSTQIAITKWHLGAPAAPTAAVPLGLRSASRTRRRATMLQQDKAMNPHLLPILPKQRYKRPCWECFAATKLRPYVSSSTLLWAYAFPPVQNGSRKDVYLK